MGLVMVVIEGLRDGRRETLSRPLPVTAVRPSSSSILRGRCGGAAPAEGVLRDPARSQGKTFPQSRHTGRQKPGSETLQRPINRIELRRNRGCEFRLDTRRVRNLAFDMATHRDDRPEAQCGGMLAGRDTACSKNMGVEA